MSAHIWQHAGGRGISLPAAGVTPMVGAFPEQPAPVQSERAAAARQGWLDVAPGLLLSACNPP